MEHKVSAGRPTKEFNAVYIITSIKKSMPNLYSLTRTGVDMFLLTKCLLRVLLYLKGLDIHLLQLKVYCCEANRSRYTVIKKTFYESRLKSSWTGGSAPLLCRGRR
jgi:hypothetical protein